MLDTFISEIYLHFNKLSVTASTLFYLVPSVIAEEFNPVSMALTYLIMKL